MVQQLATSPVLAGVGDLTRIAKYLSVHAWEAGESVVHEGDAGRAMFFVLAGQARIVSGQLEVGQAGPGEHFGELALLAGRRRNASVVAVTDLEAARLDGERFDALCVEDPDTALALLRRLLNSVGGWLSDMTESVGLLLQQRSLPRRTSFTVTVGGEARSVGVGTPVGELLPDSVDGQMVVAALVDQRPVALSSALSSDCVLTPLTTASWEGRRVYHDSLGLMLLEAASQCAPGLDLRLEHGIGFGRRVTIEHDGDYEPVAIAAGLEAIMHSLVEQDRPLREEHWTVDEARSHFRGAGWRGAAGLLATWRAATVPLVSYGQVYALRFGPLLPSTGVLSGFRVLVDDGGLLLVFGGHDDAVVEPPDQAVAGAAAAVSAHTRSMTRAHQRWLGALGATTVGELNRASIRGHAAELIRVSEGFQEKRIGQVADAITRRGAGNGGVRIVCIAGPSSSGKTTFMKRLRVQLQVDGLQPVQLSLDDYYVSRPLTPRDADGELDYVVLRRPAPRPAP